MHDGRHEGGKRHAVRQRESGAQHERRILLVGSLVKGEIRSQNAGRIVRVAKVVKAGIGAEGKVAVEVGPGKSKADGAQHHDDDAHTNVGDGKGRCLQGREQETANGGPIERDGEQADARLAAEQLIDENIVGRDPGGEREDLQELSHDLGNPLVAGGGGCNNQKELVSSNLPAIGQTRVGGRVVMKSVHDGEDQIRGPHHGSGPDEKSPHDASQTKAHGLGRDDEKNLEAPTKVLVVENLLRQ